MIFDILLGVGVAVVIYLVGGYLLSVVRTMLKSMWTR